MTAQPNKSLIDGLACMQYLASSRTPVGCRDMARQLGLNPMRANRLLKTLADIGLAQQDQKKKYSIGPGIHALTAQAIFGSSVLKQALPLIKQIKHPGLTVAIGVLWRGYVTYLFHGNVDDGLENGIGRIGLVPCFNSSIGKLLVSYEDDAEIDRLFKESDTKTSKQELLSTMRQIRKQNYAVVHKGTAIGIAVPIGNPPHISIAFAGIPKENAILPYVDELQRISEQIKL